MTTFKTYLIESFEVTKDVKRLTPKKALNKEIWDETEKLRPEVRGAMLKIAKQFIEFLTVSPSIVKDIIFTGSLANYNYTKYSDFDIHVVIKKKKTDKIKDFDFQDLIQTKRFLWNEVHNIHIYGHPVELYTQMEDEKLEAAAIYSIKNDKWVKRPTAFRKSPDVDAITARVDDIKSQIDTHLKTKTDKLDALTKLKEKIYKMRKAGLASGGEMSTDNLVFKVLRNEKYIDKLVNYMNKLADQQLSVARAKRNKLR